MNFLFWESKKNKLLVAMTIDVSLKNNSFYSDRFDKSSQFVVCMSGIFFLSAVFTF